MTHSVVLGGSASSARQLVAAGFEAEEGVFRHWSLDPIRAGAITLSLRLFDLPIDGLGRQLHDLIGGLLDIEALQGRPDDFIRVARIDLNPTIGRIKAGKHQVIVADLERFGPINDSLDILTLNLKLTTFLRERQLLTRLEYSVGAAFEYFLHTRSNRRHDPIEVWCQRRLEFGDGDDQYCLRATG